MATIDQNLGCRHPRPPLDPWWSLRARTTSLFLAGFLTLLLAAPDAYPQDLIESVTIECDLPRCQRPAEMQRLLRLTGLTPQTPFSSELGDAAAYFLERTGFFEHVTWSMQPGTQGGLNVILTTRGQRFIRRVHIDSGLALQSEIQQRIFMRSGQPFDPTEIDRQIEAILDLFEKDGYYGTQVELHQVDVEPYLVDLQVTVSRGQRLDIRRVYLKGNRLFPYPHLRSLVLRQFGFFRTFTAEAFDRALKELTQAYRDAGHYRVQFLTRSYVPYLDQGYVDLFFEIREGPRWEIHFQGNRHFTESELLDRLPFAEIGYIGPEDIADSATELEALYRTAGYFFARVQAREIGISPLESRVEYSIYEGPRAEIRQIRLEGNDHISSQRLTALMSTRKYGLLESGGYLQPEQMEADIRAIEAYYHEQGYLGAYVPRWTVIAEDQGASLFVTLFIHEGLRTRVREVRFTGNRILSSDQLATISRLRPGSPFNPSLLQRGQNAITEEYAQLGYRTRLPQPTCITDQGVSLVGCPLPRFPDRCLQNGSTRCADRIRQDRTLVECTRLAPDLGCHMQEGVDSPEVTVEYQIEEGDLVTVGEIFVTGNFQTREGVIRREFLLREQDPYNYTLLLEGQSNLRNLGLFNSVSVRTIGIQSDERFTRDRAAIVVAVEERTSQFMEFRVGLLSQNTVDNQFRLVLGTEATYADQNFFGRAEELRIGGSFQFEITGVQRVAEGEFIVGAGVVYLDPRFYWLGLADEPWEGRLSLSYLYDLVSLPQNRREVTLTLLGRREFRAVRGLAVNLEADFKLQETRSVPEQLDFDQRLILQLSPSLSLDRRDHPINPRRGYFAELALDLADDFIAINTEQYTRIRTRASAFLPLFHRFVLGAHLNFGFALGGVLSLFDTPEDPTLPTDQRLILPPGERFRLGGVSGLRGFPDSSLGPRSPSDLPLFGDVVLNGVLELRYPLLPDVNIHGAYFLETGQLAADFIDLSFSGFRYTTGLGIRWLAFGLVPVVLDYGLVLDRQPGEALGKFYLNVGYTF
ncbi:MAG: BamA/TamA family outer membrane protein [Bradymonadales bacterium]|nr:BamA/TamA family outer membrane protein [Bradymonadales bacterium]